MGNISIKSQSLSFTPVPDFIIESLLRSISSDSSKVILALINIIKRNSDISTEVLSTMTGLEETVVFECLNELSNIGLIRNIANGQLSFELVLSSSGSSDETTPAKSAEEERTDDEINFRELMSEMQSVLGITLNRAYIDLVHSLKDDYHFPDEVILTLINYCASKKKISIKYIEQVAINWKEKGIKTIEDAHNIIKEYEEKWIRYRKALNYMGLKPEYISQTHEKLLDRWFNEYKLSDELIQKAADITILNLGKAEIAYMEKILCDWISAGVKTIADVDKYNEKRNSGNSKKKNPVKGKPSNFNSFNQRNNDLDELENRLLGWKKNG